MVAAKTPVKASPVKAAKKGAIPHKSTEGGGIKYSKVEVLDLKRVFDGHDVDKNGQVTPSELHKSLVTNKHFTSQGREAFRAIDTNGDGSLTFDEYLRACFPYATTREFNIMMSWAFPAKVVLVEEPYQLSQEQLDDMHLMFNLYDKDKSGKIEYKELIAGARACGYEEDELELLFTNMDTDKDQLISFEEFSDLMSNSFIGGGK